MKPAKLVGSIRDAGIELSLTDDYRLRAFGKGLSDEKLEPLRAHRDEIIDHLCGEQFQFEICRISLPDDVGFIVRRLRHASNQTRLAVVRRWHSEFAKAWQAEPAMVKKDNAGRFRANSWLREKLEDETSNGQ